MQSIPSAFMPHAPPVVAQSRKLNRNVLIAGIVVLFHVATLWSLHTGLLRRVVEVVVPLEILSQVITPELAKTEPKPPAPSQREAEPVRKPREKPVERPVAPLPKPQVVTDAAPAREAPTGVLSPQPAASPLTVPESARPATAPTPAKVELPSSNASYLHNPAPVYPALSKRLGEQGKVLVRVLIGADGSPQQAELKRSSGFERLDRSALEYVMKCRYVPGKVAGVPQAMWYEAPVSFVLE
jgi:protein TonB